MTKETFIKAWARELDVSEDDLYDFYNKVITFETDSLPQQPSDSAGEEVYVECEDDPTEDGIYFVVDENGARFADRWIQGKWYSYPIHPIKYWLKKLTRPTVSEEEINVFSREECIFNYCPHPEKCKDECQCKSQFQSSH